MSLAASFMLLAAVAPAAAQPKPAQPTAQASSHEAEVSLARIADCVVRQNRLREEVKQYLRLAPDDPKAKAMGPKLMTIDCLDHALPKSIAPKAYERSNFAGYMGVESFNTYLLQSTATEYRAALYAALYRYSFGKTGPGEIAQKAPLTASSEWDEMPNPLPDGWRVRRALGDCMARGHPAAAHRFVLSTPWSAAEDGEIHEMTTALAECLPAGQTVSVDRQQLRGIVGEALYKLAVAPVAPSNGGAK